MYEERMATGKALFLALMACAEQQANTATDEAVYFELVREISETAWNLKNLGVSGEEAWGKIEAMR